MKIKIPEFKNAKTLVVGDIMLDRYWQGNVGRISPEAPVPIVHIQETKEMVGGAGNVAFNINALGGKVKLQGLVGDDSAADFIEKILQEKKIEGFLQRIPNLPTISKLRVIGHNQQLIRLDFEKYFKDWNEDNFLKSYLEQLEDSDLVILSDYGKGTLSGSRKLIETARKMNKPILVDPKSKDFSIYQGATIITPNMAEFEAVVGTCYSDEEIEEKARKLIKEHDISSILITRGAKGMILVSGEEGPSLYLKAEAREVYDVTGAGDTVIATLGAALATGEDITNAATLANVAAGEVVKKLGTSTVSSSELRRAIQKRQNSWAAILDEEHLLQQIEDAKLHGEKIVMTNGCFDIIHSGHVTYLEKTKDLGDRLIVAVNDDNSVSSLKGSKRPINKLQDRMSVLAALGSVDWVVPFSEDTPERLIKKISPDILTKGGDYKAEEIAGSKHVLESGGEVVILPFEEGFSTSSMIEKVSKE